MNINTAPSHLLQPAICIKGSEENTSRLISYKYTEGYANCLFLLLYYYYYDRRRLVIQSYNHACTL